MPLIAALPALISTGAGIAGSLITSGNQSKAISSAAQAQQQANQQALGEQQREFGINQQNLAPWLGAGQGALSQQLALLGIPQSAITGAQASAAQQSQQPDYAAYVRNNPDLLAQYQAQTGYARGRSMADYGQQMWSNFDNSGRTYTPFGSAPNGYDPSNPQQFQQPVAASSPQDTAGLQQQAIDQLKGSPLFTSIYNTGKDSILANAAATGGLRGGNTQNSLARFGGDALAQVIQQQLSNLGGISGAGQNAAGTLGTLGQNNVNAQSTLLQQGGANQAGAILGQANVRNGGINVLTNGIGSLAGNPAIQQALGSLFGGGGAGGNAGALSDMIGLF